MNNQVTTEALGSNELRIKEFFDGMFKNVKFDKSLYRKVRLYRSGFLTQTKDHISFFGGSLLGTNIVRFKSNYVREFFLDIINIEPTDVAEGLENVPGVNPLFKVSGDPFNQCLFYMAHRFLNSPIKEGAKECVLIFNYRTIAALISKRFRFQANLEIAIATYESLSNKFILKKTKSWVNFLDYRADKLLEAKAPYRANLITMKNEKLYINTIAEANSSIRSTFNILYGRYLEIRDSGEYTKSASIIDTMDETAVGDVVTRLSNDTRRVVSDVMLSNTFYNEDVIKIMKPMIPEFAEKNIGNYIRGLSRIANTPQHSEFVSVFIRELLAVTYDKAAKAPMTDRERASPASILHVVKLALYATRVTDDALLKLKDDAEKLVHIILPIKSGQRITAIKHAIMLYVFIYSLVLQ